MKNKGFTLIELIAVVVIMGMILLIVFPATSRLIRSNENKKYDNYYDAVQEQLELYARTRRDELGGIKGSGCVDDKKISELKSYDYIKEFTDEKDITCLSPGDFTTNQLGVLGIDTSKNYVNIRIENNQSKISVEYSMICVRNYSDPNSMSLQYSKLIERTKNCESYTPVVSNSLLSAIKNSLPVTSYDAINYVKDNPNNNYVWYSGKMWRIISYDTSVIKLVTDDAVTILNYDNNKDGSGHFNNNYSTSNIFLWLKNEFLPTLRNPDKFLAEVEWNYSPVAANVNTPITSGTTVRTKVGLINNFEYNIGANYLKKTYDSQNHVKTFWLISTTGTDSAWYVNKNGAVTSSNVSSFYGIRPSIALKSNVKYVSGGTGTISNPYRLVGDNGANIGTNLNTRFAGEYVTVGGITYRISSIDARYTKLVATNAIQITTATANRVDHINTNDYSVGNPGTIKYHYFDNKYSDNTFIGSYLNYWSENIQSQLVEGDFCRRKVEPTTKLTADCSQEDIINTTIAIPTIGELFTTCNNNEYWTINNSDEAKAYVIKSDCTLGEKATGEILGTISDYGTVRSGIVPVIVVNNTVTISGGNGTPSSPYTLQ